MSETRQAGRELDALIAEKVMGWTVEVRTAIPPSGLLADPRITEPQYRAEFGWRRVPYFSTQIADAWAAFARMVELGYSHPMVRYDTERTGKAWTAAFGGARGDGHSAPSAICRAALTAIGGAPPTREGERG